MPKGYLDEFKRDIVAVARWGDLTVPGNATDFRVAEGTARYWMRQADVNDGLEGGVANFEQSMLVKRRREERRLETENEILRHAAACFAFSGLPKALTCWSLTWLPQDSEVAVDLRGGGILGSGVLRLDQEPDLMTGSRGRVRP